MKSEKKDKHFIKKPYYEGGMTAMRKFIADQMEYPKEALEKKIEGTVVVKYTINYKGKVIETKVISSLGYGCDEEAKRLVGLLKFKVPKNRGIKIKFHKNLHIHFNLPTAPPTPPGIQYNYSEAKKTSSQTSESGSYHYTISIPPKS